MPAGRSYLCLLEVTTEAGFAIENTTYSLFKASRSMYKNRVTMVVQIPSHRDIMWKVDYSNIQDRQSMDEDTGG